VSRRHWLFKTEPSTYSWDDLERDGRTHWDGVRNYQARNLLRDEIAVGDRVLWYHSNADPPAAIGVAEVLRAGYPDPSQFDPASRYHDDGASPDNPRWYCVDVGPVKRFRRPLPLAELRELADSGLQGMELLRKGSRLSVQPLTKAHFDLIAKLGR